MRSYRSPYGVVIQRELTGWRWVCWTCPPFRQRQRSGLHKHYRFSSRPHEKTAWERCLKAANFHVYKDHLYRQ
jgi:hypothetical protein